MYITTWDDIGSRINRKNAYYIDEQDRGRNNRITTRSVYIRIS